MSDGGFLKRWSRKKRTENPAVEKQSGETRPSNLPPHAGEGFVASPSPAEPGKAGMGDPPPSGSPNARPDEDAIDPATLPPLESLGPDSDYTVFLRKGVPEALRLAALRKAWMSDPFIRDFRSPAIDYGWDFTTPDYSLRAGDDVAKMLDRIFPPKASAPATAAPPAPASQAPKAIEAPSAASELNLAQKQAEAGLPPPAPKAEPEPPPPRRKHGGALPD